MKCAYCFARFCNVGEQSGTEETVLLLQKLSKFGFKKINFVGGEPLLLPDLNFLLKTAKTLGFYTSIVTNGLLLTEDFLKKSSANIDQIGMSIDSLNYATNKEVGRMSKEIVMNEFHYRGLLALITACKIDLKINTVVSRANIDEDMSSFINEFNVQRWKVFQVLKVIGENSRNFHDFEISQHEFTTFVQRNKNGLLHKDILIKENEEIMRGSYIMVNPDGCFFDNIDGSYNVSGKIVENGVEEALAQINYDYEKFLFREGNYYLNNIKIAL